MVNVIGGKLGAHALWNWQLPTGFMNSVKRNRCLRCASATCLIVAGADFVLIGAAQKVEHCEMAGYITARNLARQLQMPGLV